MESDLDLNLKIYGFELRFVSQILYGFGLELGSQNKWIWIWTWICFLPWIGLDFGSNNFFGFGFGLGFEFSNGFEFGFGFNNKWIWTWTWI